MPFTQPGSSKFQQKMSFPQQKLPQIIKNRVDYRHRLAGQGSSALEVSGQSIPKCSKNKNNTPLNSTQSELGSN